MRILFMGTPDFAVPCLQALIDNSKYDVCGVFTQTDKPRGRKQILTEPPVKELAVKYNIPIFQPKTLRTQEAFETIKNLNPDFIVVVAYGKILPKNILDIPRFGCVNVHGSLLPKYRGAAPIQWAVLNGDKKTGITTMYMAEGIDTGDILLQEETPILPNETSGELFDRLKEIGASLLIRTLQGLEQHSITPVPQPEEGVSHVSMLDKTLAVIDWNVDAGAVHNKVRGMSPWPVAVTEYQGKKLKVYKTEILNDDGCAGKAFQKDGEFCVYCKTGAVRLCEVQYENGKRMSGKAFLLGHPLNADTSLL